MSKKLTSKALAKFEAERNVWKEVLDGVREIKAGGGKRTKPRARWAEAFCEMPKRGDDRLLDAPLPSITPFDEEEGEW